MTAALEGGEWSAARPGHTLPPGMTRYPFYRRLGEPQRRSGRADNLVTTGNQSRTAQPVDQSLYRLSYPAHTPYLCLHVITGNCSVLPVIQRRKYFSCTHDSTSSPSNTISVTRMFYSPDSGRANLNVNCHNLLPASTPFSVAAIAGDPSAVTTKTRHALPSNSKSLIQSLHHQFRLQYLYSQQLLVTPFHVE